MGKTNQTPGWLTGVLLVLQTLVDFAAKCGAKTVVTPAFRSEFHKLY